MISFIGSALASSYLPFHTDVIFKPAVLFTLGQNFSLRPRGLMCFFTLIVVVDFSLGRTSPWYSGTVRRSFVPV